MMRKKFLHIMVLFSCLSIFIKVYQSNRYIKKNYEKQRLEKALFTCKKKIDEVNVTLFSLKNYTVVQDLAHNTYHMDHTQLHHIIHLT